MISLRKATNTTSPLRSLLTTVFHLFFAVGLFCLSLPSYSGQLDRRTYDALPRAFKEADRSLGALQLTNSYGLFRRMTGVGGRPEVVLEGALDPQGPWQEFEFLYKPGNISEAPKFMLPHQPRLDWQMWFAALGSYQQNPWFISLVQRLLEGKQDVMDLLDPGSPFKSKPPKYIRALLYKYTFSASGSKDWWERTLQNEYLPIVSKKDGLDDILRDNGIIGSKSMPGKGLVADALASFRMVSNQFPHHIQIWSFAWLTLPLVRPFFFTVI